MKRDVAKTLRPLVSHLIGDAPVRIDFWDGSSLGPDDGKGTLRVKSPNALRRILWAPNELGPGRAYVAGEIEAEGDILSLIEALKPAGVHLRSADVRRARRGAGRGPIAAARSAACASYGGSAPAGSPPFEATRRRRRSVTTTTSATSSTRSCSVRR